MAILAIFGHLWPSDHQIVYNCTYKYISMVYYIFQTFENIVATFVCSASNGHRENFAIEIPWHNADIQDPIVVSLCSAAHMPEKLCYL